MLNFFCLCCVVSSAKSICKKMTTTNHHIIEYRVQAMRRAFGLFDHYFLVINDKEYHPGNYKPGKVLPVNTTKGHHVVSRVAVCDICYNKIVVDLQLEEDVRLFNYYPILNCETLCFGFSAQSLPLYITPFLGLLLWQGQILYAILMILACMLILLMRSKYVFSRTNKLQCRHIATAPEPKNK